MAGCSASEPSRPTAEVELSCPSAAGSRSRSRVHWLPGCEDSVLEYEPQSCEEEEKYHAWRRIEDNRLHRRGKRPAPGHDGNEGYELQHFARHLHCDEILEDGDALGAPQPFADFPPIVLGLSSAASKQIASVEKRQRASAKGAVRLQRGKRLMSACHPNEDEPV